MTFAGEFLGLPGLRGYWPMGAFDSSGNAIDQSGNARTLTYTGNPTFNYTTQGGPYCDYDGTGDYHTRADEAGLDILGSESYVATAVRGLTVGGWFYFAANNVEQNLICKDDRATNRSYNLRMASTGAPNMFTTADGSTAFTVTGSSTMATSTWYFLTGRFRPSVAVDIFLNGASNGTNTSSPIAAIFNGTSAFRIGTSGASSFFLTGRAGMVFLCAMALSDTAIDNIYQGTRDFYGV